MWLIWLLCDPAILGSLLLLANVLACCCRTCLSCLDGIAPDTEATTIAGATGSAAVFNGSYDLPFLLCDLGGIAHTTNYIGRFDVGGGTLGIDLFIQWDGVDRRLILVVIGFNGPTQATYLLDETPEAEPYDCTTFTGLSIPKASGSADWPATITIDSP